MNKLWKDCYSIQRIINIDIFINSDGNLKAIHDDLIDDHYRAVLTPPTNYAPEKLKNFTRLDTDLALRKEAVFSMGMTLL